MEPCPDKINERTPCTALVACTSAELSPKACPRRADWGSHCSPLSAAQGGRTTIQSMTLPHSIPAKGTFNYRCSSYSGSQSLCETYFKIPGVTRGLAVWQQVDASSISDAPIA